MNFKDIVNRDIANLDRCEHEPIHIPGSIQPHGFLLAVATEALLVAFASGNTSVFTGFDYQQLLGKPFEVVFGNAAASTVKEKLAAIEAVDRPVELELNGTHFTCSIHRSESYWILEFEPVLQKDIAPADIYAQARQFTGYMQAAGTLQALCQSVVTETRRITGYDRVMIYKFDADFNGEVYAESKAGFLEPFLGLHYPHTDIPPQARQLYVKNLLRLIVDVNYEPVPIYTIDDTPGKNLDLGLSALRSVSPIHIEYLKNMQVASTLTISLIHEGALWGLIACHHSAPKYLSPQERIAAQLQGHFLASQINVRELAEEYAVAKVVDQSVNLLLAKLNASNMLPLSELVREPALLLLANAQGVVIFVNNICYTQGTVPVQKDLVQLINWLHTYSSGNLVTNNMAQLYPEAAEFCALAAGIIFHPLGSGANDCILWCRPEALQQINWAGNPGTAVSKSAMGLSPRKSFELWKEIKSCESNKWQNPEVAAAASFAHALQKHVFTMFLMREELKQRTLNEKLEEANAELENLHWIGSHDLKEPLRKIQLYASRILDTKEQGASDAIIRAVAKMNNSAKRMQLLISDIVSYSQINQANSSMELVNLGDLLQQLSLEINTELSDKNGKLTSINLPSINGNASLLHQLFLNLLRNSVKFSKDGIPPHIAVTAEIVNNFSPAEMHPPGNFYKIEVADNGIGFDNRFSDAIFKVFSRLHNITAYSGSGVGLALCRKIMQQHNGYIIASGTPGIGAIFSLYFPR